VFVVANSGAAVTTRYAAHGTIALRHNVADIAAASLSLVLSEAG